MTETATEPQPVSDERIYEDLKAYADAGLLQYVLPTDPLGEQWIVGWNGQILKFLTTEGIVGFLTGIQATALFAARIKGDVPELKVLLSRPQRGTVAAVGETGTEWCVAYGGDDANDCVGHLAGDEAEAQEIAERSSGGKVWCRTFIATCWEPVADD